MSDLSGARAAIAAEVRAEVARQRISQMRLAEVLGTSQASVSRKLRGVQSFSAEEVLLLAEALDVPVDRFLPLRAHGAQNSVELVPDDASSLLMATAA